MEFKTFFFKKVMLSFFVSITCICAAMALIGMIFEPSAQFGYEAYLSPLVFGFLASLSTLMGYSKSELSIKQAIIRNVIQLLFIEAVILSVLYLGGAFASLSVALSLAASIIVIFLTVNLVLWVNDKKTAKTFNDALKGFQSDYRVDENQSS